ncbi:unnamed protein product [Rotaria socialis]|uniref:Uncharacterized protein n=1 Tax=Rotaria socialis TaxID=392032 RepID=A0A818RW45_9BILA|nr:unnamed protein product [Rotaria socialis]CAF4889331.1 unnamed protein product [Rotaria socialis]
MGQENGWRNVLFESNVDTTKDFLLTIAEITEECSHDCLFLELLDNVVAQFTTANCLDIFGFLSNHSSFLRVVEAHKNKFIVVLANLLRKTSSLLYDCDLLLKLAQIVFDDADIGALNGSGCIRKTNMRHFPSSPLYLMEFQNIMELKHESTSIVLERAKKLIPQIKDMKSNVNIHYFFGNNAHHQLECGSFVGHAMIQILIICITLKHLSTVWARQKKGQMPIEFENDLLVLKTKCIVILSQLCSYDVVICCLKNEPKWMQAKSSSIQRDAIELSIYPIPQLFGVKSASEYTPIMVCQRRKKIQHCNEDWTQRVEDEAEGSIDDEYQLTKKESWQWAIYRSFINHFNLFYKPSSEFEIRDLFRRLKNPELALENELLLENTKRPRTPPQESSNKRLKQ